MSGVLYPGSFDPPTQGHINIIERGAKLFGKITVVVAVNSSKKSVLSPAERVGLLKEIFRGRPEIEIESFEDQLLVEYARKRGATTLLRGLRTFQDYEYEFQMALANKQLAPEVETVFMMTEAEYAFLSSSMIREILSLGGSCKKMLPPVVEKKLREKLKNPPLPPFSKVGGS